VRDVRGSRVAIVVGRHRCAATIDRTAAPAERQNGDSQEERREGEREVRLLKVCRFCAISIHPTSPSYVRKTDEGWGTTSIIPKNYPRLFSSTVEKRERDNGFFNAGG
jgi:hypothetical protein